MWKKYKKPILIALSVAALLAIGWVLYQKQKAKGSITETKKDNELEDPNSQLSEASARTDTDKANVQRSMAAIRN